MTVLFLSIAKKHDNRTHCLSGKGTINDHFLQKFFFCRILFTFLLITFLVTFIKPLPLSAQHHQTTLGLVQTDRDVVWKLNYKTLPVTYGKLTAITDNTFTSNLSRALSGTTGRDRWRDIVDNSITFNYLFSNRFRTGLLFVNNWARDTLLKDYGIIKRTSFLSYINYNPVRAVTLTQKIGRALDKRLTKKDDGMNYYSSLNADIPFTFRKSRWDNHLTVNHSLDVMKRRMERSYLAWSLDKGLSLDFEHPGSLLFKFKMTGNRDNLGYFSDVKDTPIEYRKRYNASSYLTVGKVAQYYGDMSYEITTNFDYEKITDTANEKRESRKYHNDYRNTTFNIKGEIKTVLINRMNVELKVAISKDDTDVQNPFRSRTTKDILIGCFTGFRLMDQDSVKIFGNLNRKRIDTPEDVLNDRDELKGQLLTIYERNIWDEALFSITFNTIQTHSVNINRAQAGSNKWTRMYLLSPQVELEPFERLKITHTVDLYTSRIELDFDDELQPQSNITRRWASNTLVTIRATDSSEIDLDIYIEKNDFGKLSKKGRQRVLEEGIRRRAGVAIRHRLSSHFWFKPGFYYVIRREDNLSKNKINRRDIDENFTIQMEYNPDNRNRLVLSAVRAIRNTIRYPERIRDSIDARYIRQF